MMLGPTPSRTSGGSSARSDQFATATEKSDAHFLCGDRLRSLQGLLPHRFGHWHLEFVQRLSLRQTGYPRQCSPGHPGDAPPPEVRSLRTNVSAPQMDFATRTPGRRGHAGFGLGAAWMQHGCNIFTLTH